MSELDKNIVEVAPDGKEDIVTGKEPLKKDPKKLKDRWKELKKALDSSTAFLDLKAESEEEPEEEMEQVAPEMPEEDENQGASSQNNPDLETESEDDASASDPEAVQGEDDHEDEEPTAESDLDEEASPGDEGEQEEDPDDLEAEQQDEPDDEAKAQLEEALKEEGYTDPEIAYIVHGHHSPEIDETKRAKAEATNAMSDVEVDNAKQMSQMERDIAKRKAEIETMHEQKMSEHELSHKQRMADVEYEGAKASAPDPTVDKNHRQRMLDLEYENAKGQSPDNEFEKNHRKRMADVEYESAKGSMQDPNVDKEMAKEAAKLDLEAKKVEVEAKKRQIELDLQFKEQEHKLKLKQMEMQLKNQAKMKDQLAGEKHKHKLAEAKKPPKKLKKHIDIDGLETLVEDENEQEETEFDENKCDELIDRLQELKKALTSVGSTMAPSNRKPVNGLGTGWSMDPSSGSLHHSTQGIISTFKHPDGYFQIKHGGRSVGRAASPAEAGLKIKNYVQNLRSGDTGMQFGDPMAMKNEGDVEKSNYGPKGSYNVADNVKRKANNIGDVAGEGPNTNVKSYSSKAGQLSAKQQAAKTKYKGPASAVKKYSPAEIAAYEEAQKLKKNYEDGPWAAHAPVPNGDEEVIKAQNVNPAIVGENAMANQLANLMAGRAMLGAPPPRQPTDQEMFGRFVPSEEQIAKAEAKWNNTMNWLEEASKPIASRFNSSEEEEAYWANIKVSDRDDGKSGY